MNEHVRDISHQPVPLPAPPDNAFIAQHLNMPDAERKVEDRARAEFHRRNPHASSSAARAQELRDHNAMKKKHRDRLASEADETKLFDPPFYGNRDAGNLTLYDFIKFLLFVLGSIAGLCLSTHVLALYICSSDVIPLLTDHYAASLLFASVPFTMALAIKAYSVLMETDADRSRLNQQLYIFGSLAFVGFIASATVAFAPHVVDVADIANTLATGADSSGAAAKALHQVAPYTLVACHLTAETLLAPAIAMTADKLHLSGRRIVEKPSEKQRIVQAQLDDLHGDILRASEDAAAAEQEARIAASAEAESVAAWLTRLAALRDQKRQAIKSAELSADQEFVANIVGANT